MIGSSGGHEGRFNRGPVPVFSAGGPCEQFWHGQGCPLFDVVHPVFPRPTTASPTLQGAVKDGFEEVVVVFDMPEPCKFLVSSMTGLRVLDIVRKKKQRQSFYRTSI